MVNRAALLLDESTSNELLR